MGFRNNYRKGMPLSESLIKDVIHILKSVRNRISNNGKSIGIYSFPDYPSKKTSLFKLADILRFNLSNKIIFKPAVLIYWEDTTFGNPEKYIENINPEKTKILNFQCSDISKERVDRIFDQTFGYCTIIDPKYFKGKAVEKSDINAKHDGQVIVCPMDIKEPGKIYQILIDNSISEDEVIDYRIPIVKEALDFTYLKYKSKNIRFDNVTTRVEIKRSIEVFSSDEINLINKFCNEIKLDFGELDILRDNSSKKIYIIDVNKTPYSPPADLNAEDSGRVIKKIATAFETKFTQKYEV